MVGREEDAGIPTTRRRLIAALAGGAVGSAAGCVDAETPITDSSRVLGHSFTHLPEQAQLNPWSTNYPFDFAPAIFEYLSVTAPGEPWRRADLLEAVEIDGAAVTVRFDDGFSWWNGEPVTARDLWVAERIAELKGDDRGATATLVDEYTLRYDLDRPLDRPLVFSTLLSGVLDTADWVFEPWVRKLEDATTAARREAVAEDLRGWKFGLRDAADRGFGCGPYELVEVSRNRLMLERFDEHPRADAVSVPRLWFPAVQGQRVDELLAKGWLDAGRGILEREERSIPGHIEQLAEYPTTGGTKLVLNWRNPHLERRGVRRALLCALPLETLVDNAGWGRAASLQTGLTLPAERRWLDDDLRERLRRYPVVADTDRAAAYMREAGYERPGERWVGPDGLEVTLRLQTPNWQNWASTSNIIGEELDDFGFDVEVDQVSNTAFLSVAERGEYALLPWWTDGRPHHAYDVTTRSLSALGYGLTDAGAGTDADPATRSIPADPGSDGASRRVNLVEQWRRIRRPTSTATTRDAVALFARWWNHDLPHLDVATNVTGVWGNTRDFAWPAADDPAFRTAGPADRPEYYLLKTGRIRPADGGD